MNILFVCENYIPHIGGAEIVFKNIAEGMVRLGHNVSLVTHRLPKTPTFEVISGVKIYRVNCYNRYLFTFFSILKIVQLAKFADLIQTTTFNGAPPAWLAGKLLRKPVILTVHEVWIGKWKKVTNLSWLGCLLHECLESLIYMLRYSHYICVSAATARDLAKKVSAAKISTVYNGIDYTLWNPKVPTRDLGVGKDTKFVYLFSGRPGISKGLEYLLRAVPFVRVPDAKMVALVSKDQAYQKQYLKLKRLVQELKIKDNVIFHDPVPYPELPSYIKAADCVVVPSLCEGFGFSVAEACALGKPVVASDVGSIPEVISGKFVLVAPKYPKAIAEGIEKVYRGKYNTSTKKEFSWDMAVERYMEVYQRCLRN